MSETIQTSQPEVTTEGTKSVRWGSIISWTVVIGILAMLAWGLLNSSKTRPEAGEVAPEFNMQYFNGYEWEGLSASNLSNMQGKVVVLNFWASWCLECKLEADLLEASWRKYQNDDVVFVGITYADVEPNAIQYLLDYDVTYPNAPDLGTIISSDYEITGVPETFIIDKRGVISHVQIGAVSEQLLTTKIDQLLAQGE